MMVGLNDRHKIVAEVLEAVKAGASKKNACETIDLNIRTFQRWFYGSQVQSDQRPIIDRPEPKNKFSSSEYQVIVDYCNSAEYASSPPCQIVPSLADKGVYIGSESSLYRVLKAEQQLQHRGRSKPKKASKKPTSYTATGANQVWSWDISYLPTPVIGQHYYLYLFMDIYSRKIVGAEVFAQESGEDAADLLQRSVWKEKCIGQNLVLHSDNGAPMKSFTLRAKMQDLGIITSRSRPRVSNDNPYSEAVFKTLKYCPQWPESGFTGLEDARAWVDEFVSWYNDEHRHSGIRYVTPSERHKGLDAEILEHRKLVYLEAKNKHPERWSKDIRDWSFIDKVELNPEVKSLAA
jgi:putative transposase